MDQLNSFKELMQHVFLSALDPISGISYIEKLVDLLSDTTINYRQNDDQLFRELHSGRLNTYNTLIVYKTLVEKRGYVMTTKDLNHLIDHFKSA